MRVPCHSNASLCTLLTVLYLFFLSSISTSHNTSLHLPLGASRGCGNTRERSTYECAYKVCKENHAHYPSHQLASLPLYVFFLVLLPTDYLHKMYSHSQRCLLHAFLQPQPSRALPAIGYSDIIRGPVSLQGSFTWHLCLWGRRICHFFLGEKGVKASLCPSKEVFRGGDFFFTRVDL